MASVVYLEVGNELPDFGDDQPWITIHPSGDGRFFGTGSSWKPTGEWVGYISLAEDDVALEKALEAAQQWATKYHVPTIWVEAS